jgi:sugar/nucleoside kinase (ribokinase family)
VDNPATAVVVGPLFLDVTFGPLPHVPAPGEELWCSGCTVTAGGAANQARALARLGVNVRLRSFVGQDPPGHLARALLRQDGVGLSDLEPTAYQAITATLSTPEDRAMVSSGLNSAPALVAPRPDLLVADLRAIAKNLALVQQWRAAGTRVIGDVGWDDSGRWDSTDLDPLSAVDIFTPNAAEACHYTRTDSPPEAANILARRVPTAIVTCGAAGLVAAGVGGGFTFPAFPVHTLDSTGAGDAFSATLGAALLQGEPLRRAVYYANAAAAISTESLGAAGSPTWPEIMARIGASQRNEE